MPKVEVLPIEDGATPDPQNINKHTQRGGALLENSLRKRGAFRSIASAGKGVEVPVVYAGNYTLEKAVEAGFTEIVNVHVTGNQLVNVVRDDIAPDTAEAIALGIEDNEIGKQSYQPDVDMLASLLAQDGSALATLKKEDQTFGLILDDMAGRGFVPNTEPKISTGKVVDSDIIKEKARLDSRFKENDEYIEVTCPKCGEDFFVNKSDMEKK